MNVRTMTPDDESRAIDTIVLAFVGDPMTRWVWPSSHQYLAAMPRFVRAFAGAAFARGGAFCSDEYAGAALWLPPDVHPDEERLGELMESTASPAAGEAGPVHFRADGEVPPDGAALVLAAHRGGSGAPRQRTRRCADAARTRAVRPRQAGGLLGIHEPPQYLSLLRHGFEALGTIQAGSSPTLVPMLRRPR